MKNVVLDTYLRKLGFRENIAGTPMIREAVAEWRPGCRITKDIYPVVARRCGSTPSRVERAMRHAIESSLSRCDQELIEDIFGGTIDPGKGKPCNGEFIAMMAKVVEDAD